MPTAKGWSRKFDEPIRSRTGGELRTLLDAGRYVDALPRGVREREEWQAVMEVLLSAVEGREPVRLAQVALTLALQESKPTRRHDASRRRNSEPTVSLRASRLPAETSFKKYFKKVE
jgi:hypothetical protein